jgi:hypothetical protein
MRQLKARVVRGEAKQVRQQQTIKEQRDRIKQLQHWVDLACTLPGHIRGAVLKLVSKVAVERLAEGTMAAVMLDVLAQFVTVAALTAMSYPPEWTRLWMVAAAQRSGKAAVAVLRGVGLEGGSEELHINIPVPSLSTIQRFKEEEQRKHGCSSTSGVDRAAIQRAVRAHYDAAQPIVEQLLQPDLEPELLLLLYDAAQKDRLQLEGVHINTQAVPSFKDSARLPPAAPIQLLDALAAVPMGKRPRPETVMGAVYCGPQQPPLPTSHTAETIAAVAKAWHGLRRALSHDKLVKLLIGALLPVTIMASDTQMSCTGCNRCRPSTACAWRVTVRCAAPSPTLSGQAQSQLIPRGWLPSILS